jgi:hypothetical protein
MGSSEQLTFANLLWESYKMNLAAALLLSHLVGDFPLQTNQIYRFKNKSWVGVALHAAIHVVLAALLVKQPLSVWPLLVILGVVHFIIDLIKVRIPTQRLALGFLLDQAAHIAVVLWLARIWSTATDSTLPLSILMPMIVYGFFLATLVFLWVLANELSSGDMGNQRSVLWARNHLLQLSQYAGLPLLVSLAAHWYHHSSRPS